MTATLIRQQKIARTHAAGTAASTVDDALPALLVEGQETRDEPDQGRLARAVGAENSDDPAALEAE